MKALTARQKAFKAFTATFEKGDLLEIQEYSLRKEGLCRRNYDKQTSTQHLKHRNPDGIERGT